MKATKKVTPDPEAQLRKNERKWSKALMSAGFTVVPAVILDRQDSIGLTPVEMNVLMQLANYWWQADNLPHPSKRAIAKRMGVSEKTVQRAIKRLEAAKFIERRYRHNPVTRGQLTNFYDFSGLITAAKPYAKEETDRREARRAEETTRGNRKKAKLRLVKDEGDEP